MQRLLVWLLALLPLVANGATRADTLTLLFTGDLLLDRGVRPLIHRYGLPALLAHVSPLFHQADYTIVNLECPLTPLTTPLHKPIVFRADTLHAAALHAAGITHASLANNHSLDQGYQGLASTRDVLRRHHITPIGLGATPTPTLIRHGAVTVALFAAVLFPLEHWVTPSPPLPTPTHATPDRLAAAIATYHKQHPTHYIIAIVHWGVEYQTSPTAAQRHTARLLLHAGAHALIGHHPHVTQPFHYLQNRPVFYSLGNLLFDQSHPLTQHALLALLTLTPDTLQARAIPLSLRHHIPRPQ